MNFEKIGVLFLLDYLNQLGTVKNHLLLAFKEVLLAIQSSMNIVGESVGKTIFASQPNLLNPLLKQAQGVLSYTIEKISPDTPLQRELNKGEAVNLKEHIVNSIVSAIDDEIENTKETVLEKNKLKIEALNTVKQVLLGQKVSHTSTEQAKQPPSSANVA